jgi:hypothetical protein
MLNHYQLTLTIIKIAKAYNLKQYKMSQGFRVMVFNATFNNISAISWWLVLQVKETGVSEENHQAIASH